MKELIQKYITENVHKLALKRNNKEFSDMPREEFDLLLTQIAVRQKHKQRFPILTNNYDFIFATNIAAEQASSEFAAHYKASITPCYNTVLDLTGGLGIDSIYFHKRARSLQYCEQNNHIYNCFVKNCSVLNLENVTCRHIFAENILPELKQQAAHFDLLYVDPGRRQSGDILMDFALHGIHPQMPPPIQYSGMMSFLIQNSSPNIISLQKDFPTIADMAIIKLSPMFDIKQALRQVSSVAQVHVVSVDNDCKELLLVCDYQNSVKDILFATTNIKTQVGSNETDANNIESYIKTIQKQEFTLPAKDALIDWADHSAIQYSTVGQYLLEPNVSAMKLGCWSILCKQYNLKKIHSMTHLFTKDDILETDLDFAGTIYKVIDIVGYSRQQVQAIINTTQANVKCRNFIHSPDAVKKKLHLADGGDYYLFAITDINNKPKIIISKKL